ncbi:hypothetical protein [Pontibaca methylaminivorans]|uniref:HdeA/HdeB family protein n=1 Tax=Pontibaca methylaminivorans TaxID=515897 RepID=A0A1R3X8E5_9RHOB|nr:hypothetical protein [Pontibaca methylaminivorans]SIT86682.1 hypothetical protein SAMN05421849_2370 [Pontibaca methylaminivorans]
MPVWSRLTLTVTCTLAAGALCAEQGNDAAAQTGGPERSPAEVTCGDLAGLGQDATAPALYYIMGYREGSARSNDAQAAGAGGGNDISKGFEGPVGDSGETIDDVGASSSSDSSTTTEGTQSDGAAQPGAADDAPDAGSDAAETPIRGFAQISVEDVLTACADTPDRKLSDAMDEVQGKEGAGGGE